MSLSGVIFVCALLSIGGALLWKQYLSSAQVQYREKLKEQESTFNINQIRSLKAESTKITFAKGLLANHFAVSKVFGILSNLTAVNVRFTTLDFLDMPDQSGNPYQIALSGYGKDLTTVAFQAKILNSLNTPTDGKTKAKDVIRNPIISNPTFNQNGTISFSLTASLDKASLVYDVEETPAASAQESSDQSQ
jgi:hypothetical protein